MKQFLYTLCIILSINACSKQDAADNQQEAPISEQKISEIDDTTIFSFDVNTLKSGCDNESQIICAINASIKCTLNPDFADCAQQKAYMPNFIFMNDETLQRPTSQSYKITKIKPLENNIIEVYTKSTCNGNWFGLCNGNIIYTMQYLDGNWIVKDLYAVEF